MKIAPSLLATLLLVGAAAAQQSRSPGPAPVPSSAPTPGRPVTIMRPAGSARSRTITRTVVVPSHAPAIATALLGNIEFIEEADAAELKEKLKDKHTLTPEARARIEEIARRSAELGRELSSLSRLSNPTESQKERAGKLEELRENAARLRAEFGRTYSMRAPGLAQGGGPPARMYYSFDTRQFQQRVDLDLRDATVREAAQHILERAGLKADLRLDEDVPGDVRITARVKNVKASTALDLIGDAAGVRWGMERRENKSTLRLGKQATTPTFSAVGTDQIILPLDGKLGPERQPLTFGMAPTTLSRYAFNCPHCKGRVSIVRRSNEPDCTRCGQQFQRDWKFCPSDGAKRPAARPDVSYCPLCGKRVEIERSKAGAGDVPLAAEVQEIEELLLEPAGERVPLMLPGETEVQVRIRRDERDCLIVRPDDM